MQEEYNEIVNNMEFLVKEVHKEWDRTGATKAFVIISIEEVEEVNQALAVRIAKTQESVESDAMTFEETIRLSKECFLLLRLIRKIKDKAEKANKQRICYEFTVPFDQEELQLFGEMFGAESE